MVYYISSILLQYGNSSTAYIPSTDSATFDINPSNIQDTDCGGITEDSTSCSFNATSSTMYTVVINATNDVGSNSSMMTFDGKLLNPDWVCTVYALNVQHRMNAEPIYRNNILYIWRYVLPLAICMSCTTCAAHGKSSSTICSIRGTACSITVTSISITHNYGHRHCCDWLPCSAYNEHACIHFNSMLGAGLRDYLLWQSVNFTCWVSSH